MLIAAACFSIASWGQSSVRKIGDNKVVANGLTYKLGTKNLNAEVVDAEEGLTNVVVPPTITVDKKTYEVWMIGDNAFKNCSQTLTSATMTKVFVISEKAFKDCKKLKLVNLGEKLSSVFDSAFEGCESLTSISIPAGLDLINFPLDFKGCYRLREINVDSNSKAFRSEHGVVYSKGKYSDGINLRVSKVPDFLSRLHYIKRLTLQFTNGVALPEWFYGLKIDRLSIKGEMTSEQEADIRKHFPKADIRRLVK